MKIISVVGARPNFMKIAPFIRAIEAYNRENKPGIGHILVHTGQHYDDRMNRAFFEALDIPDADINLGIGSGSHAEQVGQTMIAFEKVLQKQKPDWVVVVGDVNATCACSITAKKELVRLAHIEAGLRSRDMSMPEEINRLVTDRLADLLLTPDRLSGENLRNEGVPEERICFVGNIMIDTLEAQRGKAEGLGLGSVIEGHLHKDGNQKAEDGRRKTEDRGQRTEIRDEGFAVMTMHRPSNVDFPDVLGALVDFLCDEVCGEMPLVWPIHPRTEGNLKKFGLWEKVAGTKNMVLLNPVGYHEMLRLNMAARVMLTDSGGLQEECCVLGTPCLTLRWNTERPVTLKEHGGASVLVGNEIARLKKAFRETLKEERRPVRPELWDGRTAGRCLEAIVSADNS
ncbi:MAG: UDP-N-acetylglucosamine 2-epimerase (non-hydrolyzing) [Desulfobacteraceae bacterium]|nr:UDP-N-acetylglucosamine 2-epimerase (non-hydrolyzing) [Desulfobacteraceae bacterium]